MTTIFMPVGTSIITNQDAQVPDKFAEADSILEGHFGEHNPEVNAAQIQKNFEERSPLTKDTNPAEISSLLALGANLKKGGCFETPEGRTLRIVLLHSPEVGKACAKWVKTLIDTHLFELLTDDATPYGSSKLKLTVDDPIPLDDLDPGDEKRFGKAVDQLASILARHSTEHPDEPVYLNITGGYKGLVPYVTLFGLIMGRAAKVFYLYEDSREIIELPVYPFAFDVLEWRDQRSLLWPFQLGDLLNDEQKRRLHEALSATRLAGLIRPEPPYGLNAVGRFMEDLYSKGRGTSVSEFGQGELLLDLFENKEFSSYLKEHCIPRWRHLSFGDHIPETVDHGRGHVQRLLELALQLLVALKQPGDGKQGILTDEQLFVLLGSLWLHDVGHTGEYFTFEDETTGGVILSGDGRKPGDIFPVFNDPALLRKYHHVLSYEVLQQERASRENFLFPEMARHIEDVSVRNRLLRSIELAALYHKREMPLTGREDAAFAPCTVARGILDFKKGEEVIAGFPKVAAMLRFLDGAENQEERAGGSDLYRVTQWVLKRQKSGLEAIKPKIDQSELMQNLIDSEIAQRTNSLEKTFPENRLVRHVFMTTEDPEDGPAVPTCTFGHDLDSSKPVIGVYFIVRMDVGYDRSKVWSERIRYFLSDFKLVQSLLPFMIKVFLIEDDAGSYRGSQSRIENYDAEMNEWVHHFV